jgi:hypothetical protein
LTFKWTAKIVGVLFIGATVTAMISEVLVESIRAPDYLNLVSANENQVLIGALLLLIMTISIICIPIMMFPILKKYNERLALGYIGIRIFEGVFDAVGIIILFSLLSLSREYVNVVAPDASQFHIVGSLLLAVHGWVYLLIPIVFGLGTLVFNYLLYQLKLVPRWLSILGLIGAPLVIASGVFGMFRYFEFFLAFPIFVQEMVLGLWLIIKGFNSTEINTQSIQHN